MVDVTRRSLLGASAAGLAAASVLSAGARAVSFGNPDEPPQGAINAKNPASPMDPGPYSAALAGRFPAAPSPPATDVGDMPQFWASFNNAPKRLQNGGWARQVTQYDFQISEAVAGVNMRLTAGGIRELHWHVFAEWAFMTYGSCRITVLDPEGQAYVADVNEGDLWFFPPGYPHSLQGLGPDGCEFVIAFDDGKASEFNTLLVTDFSRAHSARYPGPEFRRSSRGVLENTAARSLHFPEQPAGTARCRPGSRVEPERPLEKPIHLFPETPTVRAGDGRRHGADRRQQEFPRLQDHRLGTRDPAPGALRELHWHPNADEWVYFFKGTAQVGVFAAGPRAVTTNFNPGDIGYVKRTNGHYVKNVGDTDLEFLEVFRSDRFEDVSLSDWLTHTPPAMVAATFNTDTATIAKFPNDKSEILPG
ncbi:MAG: cupin domain-containing protein [Stellaceae bacterium]